MGNLDQSNAVAALKTPLGGNVLVVKSFTGSEGLGEPFDFEIEALSEVENIDFDNAHGQACSIRLRTYDVFSSASGKISNPDTPFPCQPFMTSRALRVASLINMRDLNAEERPKLLQSCLADGLQLAEAES